MSIDLLPFFGDVFKVLRANVLLGWQIGLLFFFSRRNAEALRVKLFICKIVLPYQVQDNIF